MKISAISGTQILKIITAGLYVGVSAAISYLISAIAADPNLVGPLTPIVNITLVTLKQIFTDPSKS